MLFSEQKTTPEQETKPKNQHKLQRNQQKQLKQTKPSRRKAWRSPKSCSVTATNKNK